MKPHVISLDTKVGEGRRDALNFSYKWMRASTYEDAPDTLKERIKTMWNLDPKIKSGIIGCFASHYRAWQEVVRTDQPTIVCEDDAKQRGKIPTSEELPSDGACLLGGEICEPTNWRLNKAWKRDKREGYIRRFSKGVNLIDYSHFRWRCNVSIYYPNAKVAQGILDKVNAEKTLTHADMVLARLRAIKYLWFPSVFDSVDMGVSQLGKSKPDLRDYKEQKLQRKFFQFF